MREAVIVSYARTGLAKSGRGGFNHTAAMSMAAHAISHAVSKSGVEPEAVEDVYLGNGAHGAANLGRLAGLLAGLPVTTGGLHDPAPLLVGPERDRVGGELHQDRWCRRRRRRWRRVHHHARRWDGRLGEHRPRSSSSMYPAIFMPMIETADIVAERYNVSREYQDEYSLESQKRMAAAQAAGLFADEIVPMSTTMKKVDKETKEESFVDYVVDRDECNRPDTTLEGLAALPPVRGEGNFITAGNASQLSDGAAAVVLMSDEEASKRDLTPLGAFKGWAVAGCEPDEMGIGPVFAVPKLLARHGLKIDDIDLWELNEAFASQCLYARDTLGIDPAKYNVNGGSIAIGHPFGMTGARCAGHILQEGIRRKAKWGVVTMCIGGGQGAAGLFEIYS